MDWEEHKVSHTRKLIHEYFQNLFLEDTQTITVQVCSQQKYSTNLKKYTDYFESTQKKSISNSVKTEELISHSEVWQWKTAQCLFPDLYKNGHTIWSERWIDNTELA